MSHDLIIQKWFDDDLDPTSGSNPDVTLALGGQAVTASAGTLGLTHTQALTGTAVTANAGTVTVNVSIPLIGTAVTSSTGTITPSVAIALSGQAVTASAGTLTYGLAVPLSGTAVSGLAGTITASTGSDLTLALGGQAVTVSAGTLAPSTDLALTGIAVTSSTGTITPNTGSDVTLALNGVSVSVLAGNLAVSGGDSGVVQFTGGFALAFEREMLRRERERRKRLKDEEDAREAEDEISREIAQLLHQQEAIDAERRDFERLKKLVIEYRAESLTEFSPRVVTAYERALAQQNFSAMQALYRELARQMDDEDIAVLMMLLNED